MSILTPGYLLDIPGLTEAIARCKPRPTHQPLVQCMRSFEPLAGLQLGALRGDAYLVKRKVLDAQDRIVSEDHQAWLREQLETDARSASSTYERLKDAGYVLSRCGITTLYLVHDRGTSDESNFVQAEVDFEDEWTDCALFNRWPYTTPRSLQELLDMPGDELPQDQRQRVRAPAYRLRRVVDIKSFAKEAEALEMARRAEFRQRRYAIRKEGRTTTLSPATAADAGRVISADEAFPGWDAQPVKWGRIFADWMVSSAGRSGARLCEHWALQLSDYTSPKGERSMSLIPMWTTTLKLAEVEGKKGSAYELFGKLEKLDRRVKVPFAWYFFMLHGNRVDDAAARRVIAAAEAGQIVLPEHDYQVLKAWETHPYGF